MPKKIKKAIALLLAVLTMVPVFTARAQTEQSIEDYIESVAQKYGAVGIQTAVIKNGVVAECFHSGFARKDKKAMTDDTRIRTASLSKVVIAMNALKMSEEGIINLEADIGTYWGTSLPKKVTERTLLTHTSTVKTLQYDNDREKTLAKIKSKKNYESGKPGDKKTFAYSNYGAALAAATLENASGRTLDGYAREKFFEPLGVEATWYSGRVRPEKLATLYYSDDSAARTVSRALAIREQPAPGDNMSEFAGGVTCCASDYAKILAVLVNDGEYEGKRYLSVDSVKYMEKKFFTAKENGGTFSQCLTLRYKKDIYGCKELYYHTGNAYGVLSLASYDPNTKNGVVVVTTGAEKDRDSQGVYTVCSAITEYIYTHMEQIDTAPEQSRADLPETGKASLTVSVPYLYIRTQPEPSAPKTGVAAMGNRFDYTETAENDGVMWYRVEISGDTQGWVTGRGVEAE